VEGVAYNFMNTIFRSILYGLLGFIALLTVYFVVMVLFSGWDFALYQFGMFWYFVVSLAVGFGIQVGLYMYLRRAIRQSRGSKKALAVSGTTSIIAMVSCCAHYLVNILPILATAGIITFIGQYQIEFFWIGLAFNLGGIVYIVSKVLAFVKHSKNI